MKNILKQFPHFSNVYLSFNMFFPPKVNPVWPLRPLYLQVGEAINLAYTYHWWLGHTNTSQINKGSEMLVSHGALSAINSDEHCEILWKLSWQAPAVVGLEIGYLAFNSWVCRTSGSKMLHIYNIFTVHTYKMVDFHISCLYSQICPHHYIQPYCPTTQIVLALSVIIIYGLYVMPFRDRNW